MGAPCPASGCGCGGGRAEKSFAHRGWFAGRELEAITLHTSAELESRGRTAALTENFLPVELEGRLAANRLIRVHVIGLNAEGALESALTEGVRGQYEATAMSVRAKSVPLKSNSSPVSLASA